MELWRNYLYTENLSNTFLAFKKRISDRISQSAGPLTVLNMFNAQKQT